MSTTDTETENTDQATTEAIEAEQTPEATPEAEQAPEQEPEAETGKEPQNASREAARWRKQLRETETERDNLVGQVEALRRAEVDRLAEGHKIRPEALWASGVELAALLNDAGTVDAKKVAVAVGEADERLGLNLYAPPRAPNQSRYPERPQSRDSFESAFAPQD